MKKLLKALKTTLLVIFYPLILAFNMLIFGIFFLVVLIGAWFVLETKNSKKED